MSSLLPALSAGLFVTFIACCVASAGLQVIAWSRHALPGAAVSFRGLKEPERYFDKVGVYQIRLARRLLTIGGVAYLSVGILMLLDRAFG